jgi:hypothetical protein
MQNGQKFGDNTLKLLPLSIFLMAIAACSNDCDFDIAEDQIRFADSIKKDGKTYFLYTRTVGFQEKTVFFELFDLKPEYDNCEKSNIKPIYTVPIVPLNHENYPNGWFIKELTLQPNQAEKLNIVYTKNKNEGAIDYDAKFSR